MKILFLSAWFPFPPVHGSKLRISNLLRILSERHEVDLISFADRPREELDLAAARMVCREVRLIPDRGFNPNGWRARFGFLSSVPRSLKEMFSEEMARAIREQIAGRRYDRVIASETRMASYRPFLDSTPALFEEAEVGVLYDQWAQAGSPAQRFRSRLTWEKHRRYLARLLRGFDLTTVVSDRERVLLTTEVGAPGPVEVIPNGVNLEEYRRVEVHPSTNEMIFPGAFTYFPNYHAMQWFTTEILPGIRRQVAGARLVITGDRGDLPFECGPGVEHLGFLPDIRSRIASATIMVVPIREGGGTRLKILESMALGVPVAATSKGAEGLDAVSGEQILIADRPAEFQAACVRLLREPVLRSMISTNARKLVRERYDWTTLGQNFMDLVERCGAVNAQPAN